MGNRGSTSGVGNTPPPLPLVCCQYNCTEFRLTQRCHHCAPALAALVERQRFRQRLHTVGGLSGRTGADADATLDVRLQIALGDLGIPK